MTGTIRIEPATSADAEAIATIVRRLGHDENVGLPADFDADTARAWLNRLGENGTILLAYEGSIPVAFGAIDYSTVEPNTALLGVWVLPDFRRRGIGTALAEELLEFARERGYKRIRGRLPEGNEPALSFLSSIGAMVPLRNPDMRFELPL